jgi:lipopolysaccharide/colanic/teichoic acid biosynthesis glycosyltransferase
MSTNLTTATGRTASSDRRRWPAARDRFNVGERCLGMLDQALFQSILTLERKRTERSQKPFALMLLDASRLLANGAREQAFSGMSAAVASATRDTDVVGWFEEGAIVGVIYTEIQGSSKEAITESLCSRLKSALERNLGNRSKQIAVSVHLFPEDVKGDGSDDLANAKFYSDLPRTWARRRGSLFIKRAIDAAASGLLLILLLPVFAVIALAIKLTSKGPVFFRQERLGHFGVPFICLKFRTMHLSNSPKLHQDYIQKFITGKDLDPGQGGEKPAPIYKITNDPRVTRVGRFLRATSFDELPQLWNVLVGQMSLVGPRPPVRYEYELYDVWHRRRVLESKPGITGLWQVSGRSRVRFDEMVRLDLRYWRSWSLWSDLVILVRTPRAVFSRDGAY